MENGALGTHHKFRATGAGAADFEEHVAKLWHLDHTRLKDGVSEVLSIAVDAGI